MEPNIPSLVWTLQGFCGTLKSSLSHCNIQSIKHFSISFIICECSILLNTDQHHFIGFGSLRQNPITLQKLLTKTCFCTLCISGKLLLQCDMKKVFASLSNFVSESARQMLFSVLSWGKLLKSNFLMMFNISIMAKSPSTVSFWPTCYSVIF